MPRILREYRPNRTEEEARAIEAEMQKMIGDFPGRDPGKPRDRTSPDAEQAVGCVRRRIQMEMAGEIDSDPGQPPPVDPMPFRNLRG